MSWKNEVSEIKKRLRLIQQMGERTKLKDNMMQEELQLERGYFHFLIKIVSKK